MSRFDRLVPRIDVSHSILLTISRRLTIIVLGDETTLTEDTKRVSMSLGVGLSLGLFCSVELFTVLVCVLIRLFYCVGVCVGGGVATSSLFVSLLSNSFWSLFPTERVNLLTRDIWWRCRVGRGARSVFHFSHHGLFPIVVRV